MRPPSSVSKLSATTTARLTAATSKTFLTISLLPETQVDDISLRFVHGCLLQHQAILGPSMRRLPVSSCVDGFEDAYGILRKIRVG